MKGEGHAKKHLHNTASSRRKINRRESKEKKKKKRRRRKGKGKRKETRCEALERTKTAWKKEGWSSRGISLDKGGAAEEISLGAQQPNGIITR